MNVSKYFFFILSLLLTVVFWGCEREDNEPVGSAKSLSRLFVSTSDYQVNVRDLFNLFIVNYSDDPSFESGVHISKATQATLGGGAIYFNENIERIFQASVNSAAYPDTAIQIYNISKAGVASQSGRIANRLFSNVTSLTYSSRKDQLYFLNLGANYASLYAVNTPMNLRGYVRPAKEIRMAAGNSASALHLEDNNLFLLNVTAGVQRISVYKNFEEKLNTGAVTDTIVNLMDDFSLTLSGVNNVGGMYYVKSKDVLLLTDYDESENTGRVLIYEGFSTHSASGAITPSATITGAASLLEQPMGIVMDSRSDKNYIYVADAKARRVFRFDLQEVGNVAPNGALKIGSLENGNSPVSVALFTTDNSK